MIIVAGHLMVSADQREQYVRECVAVVEQARRADGCRDFAICADSVDPGRINVFERWDSQETVEAFRGAGPSQGQIAAILSASVTQYEVMGAQSLM